MLILALRAADVRMSGSDYDNDLKGYCLVA